MKRSNLERRILRVLKTWEGSQMEIRTAREVLDVVEKAGMLPPERTDTTFYIRADCEYRGLNEWEPEDTSSNISNNEEK